MKRILALCAIVLLSCNGTETDDIKPLLPGIYVKRIENEFNIGKDSLIIRHLSNNIYKITRRSAFNRIRKGEPGPLVRKSEIWTAVYNKDEQVLHETQKGKIISFLADKNVLMVGSSEYRKIKSLIK